MQVYTRYMYFHTNNRIIRATVAINYSDEWSHDCFRFRENRTTKVNGNQVAQWCWAYVYWVAWQKMVCNGEFIYICVCTIHKCGNCCVKMPMNLLNAPWHFTTISKVNMYRCQCIGMYACELKDICTYCTYVCTRVQVACLLCTHSHAYAFATLPCTCFTFPRSIVRWNS